MQTVLALPVQQKMRYSPSTIMPALTASPTSSLSSATSPSTSSTWSDNTSSSFTGSTKAYINSNLALKIESPLETAPGASTIAAPKSKRAAPRDPNVPFQYTFPTFPPSPGPSSVSPSSEPVEQTQRLTKARTPPSHRLQLGSEAYNPALHCSIPEGLLLMPDSGTISGPGPERHPKSGLARLFDKNPQLAHPYARLSEKHKDNKRRKIWSHTLEKNFFTPEEITPVFARSAVTSAYPIALSSPLFLFNIRNCAPHRRPTYIASLEAHIDRVHAKLVEGEWYPVPYSDLDPFKGLNSKTAKIRTYGWEAWARSAAAYPHKFEVNLVASMVSGLQCDAIVCNLKLLELQRINEYLEKALLQGDPFDPSLSPGPPGTEFMSEAFPSGFRVSEASHLEPPTCHVSTGL
ncbi:hypothetical protein D9619_003237 [Psilocybe cf. subviscida]|uniref:Uncharacterized protein n=1 Tax=Psilocybe cf. subviscida TaxID=2480587 RepID=A0A8H5AYV3_9AGAR|nr:hypothetical protein D9619_003237 [Psilocybe cf. subviscida]